MKRKYFNLIMLLLVVPFLATVTSSCGNGGDPIETSPDAVESVSLKLSFPDINFIIDVVSAKEKAIATKLSGESLVTGPPVNIGDYTYAVYVKKPNGDNVDNPFPVGSTVYNETVDFLAGGSVMYILADQAGEYTFGGMAEDTEHGFHTYLFLTSDKDNISSLDDLKTYAVAYGRQLVRTPTVANEAGQTPIAIELLDGIARVIVKFDDSALLKNNSLGVRIKQTLSTINVGDYSTRDLGAELVGEIPHIIAEDFHIGRHADGNIWSNPTNTDFANDLAEYQTLVSPWETGSIDVTLSLYDSGTEIDTQTFAIPEEIAPGVDIFLTIKTEYKDVNTVSQFIQMTYKNRITLETYVLLLKI